MKHSRFFKVLICILLSTQTAQSQDRAGGVSEQIRKAISESNCVARYYKPGLRLRLFSQTSPWFIAPFPSPNRETCLSVTRAHFLDTNEMNDNNNYAVIEFRTSNGSSEYIRIDPN